MNLTADALIIVLFLSLGLLTAVFNYFTIRRFDQYPPAAKFPRVSILVPARNETRNVETCAVSLLAQDYPDFEVIFLDDESSDDTPIVLSRLKRADSRLVVLSGTPRPAGWIGKHWACHQLEQAATGELILFTDADTRHAPNMLRDSVSALLAENADLVTAFPHEEVHTWGERLLVPVIGWGIFSFIPVRLVQKLHLPALSVTIGQFMLFRRDAYTQIGGYEAIRKDPVDDVSLGRNIIANGFEWRLMDGTQHITCRMYRSLGETVSGLSKSLFGVFEYRILPYLVAMFIVTAAFLEPVVSLISRWLRHPLTSLPLEYAAGSVILSIILFTIAYRRFKFPAYLVFYYPFTVAVFMVVAGLSFFQAAFGTIVWKDRAVEHTAMRWL